MAGTAPAGDEGEALLVVRRELHDQQAGRRYRDAQHLQPHADILGVRSSLDLALEHLAIGQLRPAFLCLTERSSVRRVDERLDGAVQRRHAGGRRAVASAEPCAVQTMIRWESTRRSALFGARCLVRCREGGQERTPSDFTRNLFLSYRVNRFTITHEYTVQYDSE